MVNETDILHLHQALEVAKLRRGYCAPNPSVGAVIVENNKILATGFHNGPGTDHAEVAALKKLPLHSLKDATIYVTLEPCCHYGRTPPCTDALIRSGIKRVVYAYSDPNPVVAGKGRSALTAAGLVCEQIDHNEITLFYESYEYWHRTKKPFITAKIALSMDGKIAGREGDPIAITGESIKAFTHFSRGLNDAILTTAKTILRDDPQLNVRTPEETHAKPLYILDSGLRLPLSAKVFETAKSITIFHDKSAKAEDVERLSEKGARCISIEKSQEGLNLTEVIEIIGQDGRHALWIEAGGECFSAFIKKRLLQCAYIYVAPKWLGEGKSAFPPEFALDLKEAQLQWQQFGKDALCEIRW